MGVPIFTMNIGSICVEVIIDISRVSNNGPKSLMSSSSPSSCVLKIVCMLH